MNTGKTTIKIKDVPFLVWAIYDHPKDHPNHFVVRCQTIIAGATFFGSPRLYSSLEMARKFGVPPGMTRVSRADEDDPVIVETWI